ncbi:hypothetical protein MHU86_7579 [Fragilaria crotonensis]|nr:hypothetical protein MHU86_7579 [Fragilaria crotonensis]
MVPILVTCYLFGFRHPMVDHFGLGQQSSPSCVRHPTLAFAPTVWVILLFLSVFLSTLLTQPPVASTAPPRLRSLVFNVVARDSSRSRSLRHASIQAFASTSYTVRTLRLRQQGYVASRPPTVAERDDFRHFATLNAHSVSNVAPTRFAILVALLRCRLPQAKRERDTTNTSVRVPWCSKRPRSSPRTAKYCPVAPANSPDPFAIAPLTFHQRAAANKILSHVHLACHSTPLRMALQAPARMREALGPKANTSPIIWDSGASISITPDLSDFEGPVTSPGTITQLKGIAKGLQIKGQGEVTWAVHDQLGNLRLLKVPRFMFPHQGPSPLDVQSPPDLP